MSVAIGLNGRALRSCRASFIPCEKAVRRFTSNLRVSVESIRSASRVQVNIQRAAVQNRGVFAVGSSQNESPSSGPSNDRCTYRKEKALNHYYCLNHDYSYIPYAADNVHDAPPKDLDEGGRISFVDILTLHQ